jgi:hypothetical protein
LPGLVLSDRYFSQKAVPDATNNFLFPLKPFIRDSDIKQLSYT